MLKGELEMEKIIFTYDEVIGDDPDTSKGCGGEAVGKSNCEDNGPYLPKWKCPECGIDSLRVMSYSCHRFKCPTRVVV